MLKVIYRSLLKKDKRKQKLKLKKRKKKKNQKNLYPLFSRKQLYLLLELKVVEVAQEDQLLQKS